MNILAIGAHPDDVEFGCGGTLLKYSKLKHHINLLIMTLGEQGGKGAVRKKEQMQSAKILRANVFWRDYKDTKIPVAQKTIADIEDIIHHVNPQLIFVNFYDDTHQDHRVVAECTVSATRYIKNVLFYEVPTTQNFNPNVFVDIGDVLTEKMKLMRAHKSQVNATRIAGLTIMESAESCANFRGFQGRVKYAEGFSSLRLSLFLSIGRRTIDFRRD